MDKKVYKGKLKRWNEDKGFGFIGSDNENRDIFIHISSLKRMSRRPIVGDLICYQIHMDNNGKSRAINAKIEGIPEIKPKGRKNNRETDNKSFFLIASLGLLILFGFV